MIRRLTEFFVGKGYRWGNYETYTVLYREGGYNDFAIILNSIERVRSVEELQSAEQDINKHLFWKFHKDICCLLVLTIEDGMLEQKEHSFLEVCTNLWYVARDTGKVYVFERQITDFDNLKDSLEEAVKLPTRKERVSQIVKTAPMNIGIIGVTIVYFLIVLLVAPNLFSLRSMQFMLQMGAQSYESVLNGAWYQLITSLFLHFGVNHLFNNMLLLGFSGYELEKRIGHLRFFVVYFCAGIVGNVASLVYHHQIGEQVYSAGASGAIYGVIGALIIMLSKGRSQKGKLSPARIILMAVLTIYIGFTSVGVDNAAHIGGFVTGILLGFLLSKISRYGKLEEVNFMR